MYDVSVDYQVSQQINKLQNKQTEKNSGYQPDRNKQIQFTGQTFLSIDKNFIALSYNIHLQHCPARLLNLKLVIR